MTADERIEKLLNKFGQTISDLPTSYANHSVIHARFSALGWINEHWKNIPDEKRISDEYICHLADIIDRMEVALETAANWPNCFSCMYAFGNKCDNQNDVECGYRIDDIFLYGPNEENKDDNG